MLELVDSADLKSAGPKGRVGSSPTLGTNELVQSMFRMVPIYRD